MRIFVRFIALVGVVSAAVGCQSTPEAFIGNWQSTADDEHANRLMTISEDRSMLLREIDEDGEVSEGVLAEWSADADDRIRWSRVEGSVRMRRGRVQLLDDDQLLLFTTAADAPIPFSRVTGEAAGVAASTDGARAAAPDVSDAERDAGAAVAEASQEESADAELPASDAAESPLTGTWRLVHPDLPEGGEATLHIGDDGTLTLHAPDHPSYTFNADWYAEGTRRIYWTKLHGHRAVPEHGSADLVDADRLLLLLGYDREEGSAMTFERIEARD